MKYDAIRTCSTLFSTFLRDLHKFSIVYDMQRPLEHMPAPYLNKIEATVSTTSEASMQSAADELHLRADAIMYPVQNYINTDVSFDSSWKTRGYIFQDKESFRLRTSKSDMRKM